MCGLSSAVACTRQDLQKEPLAHPLQPPSSTSLWLHALPMTLAALSLLTNPEQSS